MGGDRAKTVKDQSGRNLGSRAQKTRQRFLDATAKLLAEHLEQLEERHAEKAEEQRIDGQAMLDAAGVEVMN